MSIESVLKDDLNIKNFENLNHREAPVWDKVKSYEFDVLDYVQEEFIPFVLDCKMKDPEEVFNLIPLYTERSNKIITKDLTEGLFSNKKISIDRFLSNNRIIRLIQKDTSFDNPRGLKKSNENINNIILVKDKGFSNLVTDLKFMFDYKVNYPSVDITSIMKKIIDYESEYITKWLSTNVAPYNGGSRSRDMAFIKILYPEFFKNIDLKNTPLYKSTEKLANEWLDEDKIDGDSISFAAYLKVLASEKTFIGKHGIEIEMPSSLSSEIYPLPQIRRFS